MKRETKKKKELEKEELEKKELAPTPMEACRRKGLRSKKDYSNVEEKEDPFGVPSWAKKYHTYGSSGVK